MKNKRMALLSFVAGILVALFAPLILLAMGAINMGADAEPGFIERTIAPWALDRAVAAHATKEKNPFAGNSAAIGVGLKHFRENCLMCHGAPDVEAAELSKGINPPAPPLEMEESDTPDGELFWVIKHGIRMTAMPAFGPSHTDEEIWKLVAFIRHLPDLTAQEQDSLRAATAEAAHQGEKTHVPTVK
jgi:mono/diheme cytochrome c family protein